MLGLRNEHCVVCFSLDGGEGLASGTVHILSQGKLLWLVNDAEKLWVEAALCMLVRAPQKRFLLVIHRNAMVVTASNVDEEVLALSFDALRAGIKGSLFAFSYFGHPKLAEVVLTPSENCACICALIELKWR